MLDLILFVLAMTLGSDGETDYAAATSSGEAMVMVEEATPDATAPEEVVEEVVEEAVEEIVEEAVEEVVEQVTPEPEVADGGSWNIEPVNDGSWITNAPEGFGAQNSGGNGLLAGVAMSDDEGASAAQTFAAEPQIATGKFTTATEVRPILEATKGNWVALRDYNGQDWLYVTHIWSWRCGLHQMRYSINGGPMQVWPLPPCHEGTAAPNAIIESDGLPATTFASGAVQSIEVELLLDDLSTATAQYIRADVLMP